MKQDESQTADSNTPVANGGELGIPQELKDQARIFFEKGARSAYTLNFDYAIELYLDGLSFWPDTIEEGHKLLRDIAHRRQVAGGKKSGFGDGSKYKKASGKNPKDAMLKAEYILCKDPYNEAHMIDMITATLKGNYKDTALWMTDILFESHHKREKHSVSTYLFLRDSYSQVGSYIKALHACQLAFQMKPNDVQLKDSVRDLSAHATMEKGKYDGESDFRDSLQDGQAQAKLQDQEQIVRTSAMLKMLIAEAEKEYQAAPTEPGKINKLADALCDTEEPQNEQKAIGILEKAFQETDQFRFKQRVGEIMIRHFRRRLRKYKDKLQEEPQNETVKNKVEDLSTKLLAVEVDHYQECMKNYPTDFSFKNEYAHRLIRSKRYDDAIPLFQEVRGDPRYRISSLNQIGQCFFYKEWYPDAVEMYESGLALLDTEENDAGKELRYNLGRAHEEADEMEQALTHFRKVAQIDFNYRDVRDRVNELRNRIKK
ncbi:MAG: hypothetical protein IID32_05960 [Planctomycetes bacterium]|nr:hypothetical protein [Planctomycetota bacterium]